MQRGWEGEYEWGMIVLCKKKDEDDEQHDRYETRTYLKGCHRLGGSFRGIGCGDRMERVDVRRTTLLCGEVDETRDGGKIWRMLTIRPCIPYELLDPADGCFWVESHAPPAAGNEQEGQADLGSVRDGGG